MRYMQVLLCLVALWLAGSGVRAIWRRELSLYRHHAPGNRFGVTKLPPRRGTQAVLGGLWLIATALVVVWAAFTRF